MNSPRRWTLLLALCGSLCGCADDAPAVDVRPSARRGPKEPAAVPAQQAPTADGAQVLFTDEDFVESEGNRDPFRSYETTFQIKAPAAPQRLVLMPDVGIEQMRLIAIVTGSDKPRAMLVDPGGVGHVAARGDFIGRAEVVQTGGRDSMPVTLNWRVDRIRSTEVVLAREDPSSPNRVPMTRVLPLYDEADPGGSLRRSGQQGDDVPEFEGKQSGG